MHHSKVSFINALDYDFRFKSHAKIIDRASLWPQHLAGVVKVLLEKGKTSLVSGLDKLVQGIEVTAQHRAVAESLLQAKRPAILLGAQALSHPDLSTLRALVYAAASLVEAKWGYLPQGANSVGAQWMGVLPHRGAGGKDVSQKGLNAQAMLYSGMEAYVLLGFEPEVDTAVGARAVQSLKKAEFVLAMSAYRSDVMDEYAHVILPIAPFAENAGSFVNVEGRLQSFQAAVTPRGEARPAWKVLRVLGNMLDCKGFDYLNLDEVHRDLQHTAGTLKLDNGFSWRNPTIKTASNATWERVIDLPIYAIDGIVRRAGALQKTCDAVAAHAAVNAKMAVKLGVSAAHSLNITQGDSKVRLPVMIDERVPDFAVYVPAGLAQTAALPACSGAVNVEKN
jgi:NADH-quinone oxidoreductase subunit G